MSQKPTKTHPISQVSALALAIGFTTFSPALAQEAIIIANGEIVTDQQLLDQDGDSLTVDAGGTLDVGDDSAVIVNANDAVVENDGTINALTDAVDASGDNLTLTNDGEIIAAGDDGFDIDGIGAEITNNGLITAGNDGIFSNGLDANIVNTGTIDAADEGIDSEGDNARIVNTGSITTDEGDAIETEGTGIVIENSGTLIVANDADGIDVGGSDTVVTNSGTIEAADSGIETQDDAANVLITNTGRIVIADGSDGAAIEMNGDNGQLINTGLLSSDDVAIEGGSGTQSVTLGAGSQIIGEIDLGGGDDVLAIEEGSASAVLAISGVETLNLADDLVAFETVSGVVTIDTTGVSVLNEAVGTLAQDVQTQIAGRFSTAPDLTTRGPQAGTSGAWASVIGQSRNVGDDGAALAYDHDFAGLLAGYDRDFGGTRFGFVGGVAQGEIATDEASQDIETESVFAGVYANRQVGAFDLTGSVLAGAETHESERLVIDALEGEETATASFDSRFVSASVNATARSFTLGDVAVIPSVQATYTAAEFDGYTEEGTTNANLEVGSRNAQTLSGRAQLATYVAMGALQTELRAGIDARASFEDDISLTLNGTTLDVEASDSDRLIGGFFGAQSQLFTTGGLNVTGDVEYQFGERETDALSAALTVSFSF
ncbi:autotransporter domain-containing protein [Cognatiyoonia sp. IB215446]|uniref:autotransporter domain-containing protein n=1 Tax=Cognatiyoonia sp. IB215446 TaxID=3097355 RepID=UPI002A162C22|nr:autotransporter domain-containing protein [Cognatiyoonia sp. IB215446]MDX8348354.1 autotransporter domain-containing protein [Cognatiyoonia sp. IB215446]